MTHISPEQFQAFMTLIMAFVSAIAAFVSAVKGGQAHAQATEARAEASALRMEMRVAAEEGQQIVPGATPALSLNQIVKLLRYVDYINLIESHWGAISRLKPGEADQVPRIRTIIDGKDISIGPTPVQRTG